MTLPKLSVGRLWTHRSDLKPRTEASRYEEAWIRSHLAEALCQPAPARQSWDEHRLREAMEADARGIVCRCGNPIWVIGSAEVGLSCWFSDTSDVRTDAQINGAILQFIEQHGALSVGMYDRIIGCPHEEGGDYPEGKTCPQCPFWASRDRWSGKEVH
jgi:hypothetical protein